jgi:hypothetical protein
MNVGPVMVMHEDLAFIHAQWGLCPATAPGLIEMSKYELVVTVLTLTTYLYLNFEYSSTTVVAFFSLILAYSHPGPPPMHTGTIDL